MKNQKSKAKRKSQRKPKINNKMCEHCGIRMGFPFLIGKIDHDSKFVKIKVDIFKYLCRECENLEILKQKGLLKGGKKNE